MFGMEKIIDAIPKLLEMQPVAEQFVTEWLGFMNKLGDSVARIEAQGERTDNKVSLIISMLSEHKITADLQSEIEVMARNDPRNAPPSGELRTSPIGETPNGHELPANP